MLFAPNFVWFWCKDGLTYAEAALHEQAVKQGAISVSSDLGLKH